MDKRGIDRDRIKPEFMTALVEPIEAVYTAIRHDLCVKLAAAFNDKTLKSQGNAWRSTMLARLGSFTRSTIALIASYSGDVSRETKNAIRSAVRAGIDACEPELLQLHPGGYVPDPEPTTQRVTEMYVVQALESCNMVNTVMLNSTLRQYRKIVNDTSEVERRLAYDQEEINAETGAVILGAKSRQEAVHDAVVNMARNGITGFIDKAGREWSPDAYVNMDIRTTAAAAAREAAFERNEEYGNNLISVSAHAGARPLCYPYQGKVYSTDGTSGTVKDGHGNSIEYSPLSITSYGEPGGLFGINCGHFNYPFIPDISIVRAVAQPEAENREQYLRNQQQREQERAIRNLKTEADALEAAGFADDAKALRKRIREKNAELKDWCEENGQDYKPDRLRVTRTETENKNISLSNLHEDGSRDIITVQNKGTDNNAVNYLCKIDRNIYACVSDDITTDEVIIPNERIQHIIERHPNDYERFSRYMVSMIEKPHYIIETNKPNTAFILKSFKDDNEFFRLILRLHTSKDNDGYKNSVITFQHVREKEYRRLIKNKKILYKADDL